MATVNVIVSFSEGGIPKTGLTPTIGAWEVDGTVAINPATQTMTAISNGFYRYSWTTYDETKDYVIQCYCGDASMPANERYMVGTNNQSCDEINLKLPDDYIMGSSVQTSQDADIAIAKKGAYQNGCVWFDSVEGSAGGTGHIHNPISVEATMRTIAIANDLYKYNIHGSITLAASYANKHLIGEVGPLGGANIAIGGQSLNNALIEGAVLTGAVSGHVHFVHCAVLNVTGLHGLLQQCGLVGTTGSPIIFDAGITDITDCTSVNGVCYLNMNGNPTTVNITDIAGSFVIRGLTGGSVEFRGVAGCEVEIESNCTGGTITISGSVILTDNSGVGCVVTDNTEKSERDVIIADIAISDAVVDGIATTLSTPNNFKADVSALATEANATTNKNTIQTDLQTNEDKIDIIDTVVDAVKLKTDNLPTDPAAQSVLLLALSGIQTAIQGADSDTLKTISDQIDAIVDNTDWTTAEKNQIRDALGITGTKVAAVGGDLQDIVTVLASPNNFKADVSGLATEVNATTNRNTIQTDIQTNETKIDTIDTVVDAIKVKTDNLPSDPADQSVVESAISASQGVLTTAISTSEGNIRGGSDSLDSLSDQLDIVQTDLDNPDQYKAVITGLPSAGEYDTRLATIQADLDNPGQYKANISTLATSAEITALSLQVVSLDTLIDTLTEMVARDLGLNNENTYIDNTVFDTDGNLTSARVRSYSVAGSVGTASDVLATYTITAVGTGEGMFSTWKMVKV